jgi:hypothetical protein
VLAPPQQSRIPAVSHHTLVIAGTLEQYGNIGGHCQEQAMFFSFPEDARWNEDLQAVEFGVGVGEYEGVVACRAMFSGALSTAL